jgi:hypothetical protein
MLTLEMAVVLILWVIENKVRLLELVFDYLVLHDYLRFFLKDYLRFYVI